MKWTADLVESWAALNRDGASLSDIGASLDPPLSRQRIHQLFKLYGIQVARHVVRECSIAGCGRPHVARGYCNAHYLRAASGDLRPEAPVRAKSRPKSRPLPPPHELWPYLNAPTDSPLLTDISSFLPSNLPEALRAEAGQEAALMAISQQPISRDDLAQLVESAVRLVRRTFRSRKEVSFFDGIDYIGEAGESVYV